ncbi:MAG: hypothetical protein JO291_06325 [Acidimicrobiia bacterium]|nr:hypothetical protein [Acidimicrobiia bacterium]
MSALVFLGVALLVSLVGIAIMALRARQPTSLESGIDAFKREMDALSPEQEARRQAHRDARRR